ncbi:glucosaminidase domain-containing protein [Hanstruepera marina]|uniref:glucosaminidase domain-containing protein n=1 Tax=Hanstruepera marina TaxID=2873265 RepID=UPI001CA65483|nr:glucosaminidase domain-containing protein [Hanstruepera marina]
MKKIVVFIVLLSLVFSCGSKKRAASKSSRNKTKTERVVKHTEPEVNTPQVEVETPQAEPKKSSGNLTVDYIEAYYTIAQEEMRLYKIPASITLAQGILESASGKGRLAVEANNHFGIKCHGWTGAKIYHDDDASQECFRKYKDAKYSFRDHSLFLTERKRYYKLFNLDITDYKRWAKELKAAGYATDRKYPDKLISLIERYELYKYDEAVTGNKNDMVVVVSNEMTHKVVKGDTLYSLSKRYNTTVDELKRLNDLSSNNLKIGEVLVVKSN